MYNLQCHRWLCQQHHGEYLAFRPTHAAPPAFLIISHHILHSRFPSSRFPITLHPRPQPSHKPISLAFPHHPRPQPRAFPSPSSKPRFPITLHPRPQPSHKPISLAFPHHPRPQPPPFKPSFSPITLHPRPQPSPLSHQPRRPFRIMFHTSPSSKHRSSRISLAFTHQPRFASSLPFVF